MSMNGRLFFWRIYLMVIHSREKTERRKVRFEMDDEDEEEGENDEVSMTERTCVYSVFDFRSLIKKNLVCVVDVFDLHEQDFSGTSWKENISKKFAISYVPNKTINWTKLVYGES